MKTKKTNKQTNAPDNETVFFTENVNVLDALFQLLARPEKEEERRKKCGVGCGEESLKVRENFTNALSSRAVDVVSRIFNVLWKYVRTLYYKKI